MSEKKMEFTPGTIVLNESLLKEWASMHYNILLLGFHGVGKTEVIKSVWEKMKLKYRYFNAATLDPWVDFIGIPKAKTDKDGNDYVDLVRPKFHTENIEALFIDEISRCNPKISNAIFELIQFKSINGHKFPKLKMVWCAANPGDDENYNTSKMDAALVDRFHIITNINSEPSQAYFAKRFNPELADSAIAWVKTQPVYISPRRLEYALQAVIDGTHAQHVLPKDCNIPMFMRMIKTGSAVQEFNKMVKENASEEDYKKFFSKPNNVSECYDILIASDGKKPGEHWAKLNYLPKENIMAILRKDKSEKIMEFFTQSAKEDHQAVKAIINEALQNESDKELIERINKTRGKK